MFLFYLIGLLGMWFFTDAIFSLCLYMGKPDEKWLRNHLVRIIRLIGGIGLIIIGGLGV